MPGLELWANPHSTCTQRVLFTAAELNAPYKLNTVDFATGQHKSPEHIKRQPFGKVPAAEWDGVPFYESRAICRVLAEAYSNGPVQLIPTDLKKKAVFEQWASLENNTITPQLDVIVGELVFSKYRGLQPIQANVDAALEKVAPALTVMNDRLGDVEYLAGDFSLVDIFFTPGWHLLQNTEPGKDLLARHPNIAAWWQRTSNRPAWKKVVAK